MTAPKRHRKCQKLKEREKIADVDSFFFNLFPTFSEILLNFSQELITTAITGLPLRWFAWKMKAFTFVRLNLYICLFKLYVGVGSGEKEKINEK